MSYKGNKTYFKEHREEILSCLKKEVLKNIDMSRDIEDMELIDNIFYTINGYSFDYYLGIREKLSLGRDLFNIFRKLDILQDLLEDKDITEIMINGIDNIFYEKKGRLYCSEKRFYDKEKLETLIQSMLSKTNRMVNEASPIVDSRLPDGSRVNIVLPPIAINGPIVTIRKFENDLITLDHLIHLGSINQEIKNFLIKLVKSKYNIFISGGTGSGKTTFLNALSGYIPREERIITIEDSAELVLKDIPNLVSLETRNANVEGVGEIKIRNLIKTALRMRPERIIVGEVRGEEAIDMLQAFNTGHDGSLCTGHANTTEDMLTRLEVMVLFGTEIPLIAIRKQIASSIDIIIHLGRLRDKSRKVLEISEILGVENSEVRINKLYEFVEEKEKSGKVFGTFKKVGDLRGTSKLFRAGYKD